MLFHVCIVNCIGSRRFCFCLAISCCSLAHSFDGCLEGIEIIVASSWAVIWVHAQGAALCLEWALHLLLELLKLLGLLAFHASKDLHANVEYACYQQHPDVLVLRVSSRSLHRHLVLEVKRLLTCLLMLLILTKLLLIGLTSLHIPMSLRLILTWRIQSLSSSKIRWRHPTTAKLCAKISCHIAFLHLLLLQQCLQLLLLLLWLW